MVSVSVKVQTDEENVMVSNRFEVLMVEDDPVQRENIVESLAIYGYPVTAVDSGLKFYQVLNQRPFAIVLIDLGLPDMIGYSLVSYLRQNTDLKIIILTSRDEVIDRVNGYNAGADLYLTKPVIIQELAAAIASIASRGGQPATGPKSWRLERLAWRLYDPSGAEFSLGQKEATLLAELAATDGVPRKREEILLAVYGKADAATSGALDVLLYRVRRRFTDETGKTFPLLTVPGVGFHFSAPLTVI